MVDNINRTNPNATANAYAQMQSRQIGVNPFTQGMQGAGEKRGPSFGNDVRHLDSAMLEKKAADTKVGMGGASTPPDDGVTGLNLWECG